MTRKEKRKVRKRAQAYYLRNGFWCIPEAPTEEQALQLLEWGCKQVEKRKPKFRKLRAVWAAELDQTLTAMYHVQAEAVLVNALNNYLQ